LRRRLPGASHQQSPSSVMWQPTAVGAYQALSTWVERYLLRWLHYPDGTFRGKAPRFERWEAAALLTPALTGSPR